MAKKKTKKTKPKPKPKPPKEPPTDSGNGGDQKEEGEPATPSPRRKRFRHSIANTMKDEQSPAEEHFLGKQEEPVQGELLKIPEQPAPSPIVEGRIAMHFLNYSVDRTEERDLEVTLRFSLDLVKEHEGHLPEEIEDAWKDLEAEHYTRIDPPLPEGLQNLELTLDVGLPPLTTTALLDVAHIERVQERGKGKNREITRLTMRFITDLTDDVDKFCRMALDETVYAKIEVPQKTLEETS